MISEIHLTHDPIVIPPLTLPTREIGSVVEFQGLVREMEADMALTGLFYEAHEPMARKRLEYHFGDLQKQHPVAVVLFSHRLGWVPVGGASLFIRVLSSHRAEGLSYLSGLVVRLKQDVPIWKLTKPVVWQDTISTTGISMAWPAMGVSPAAIPTIPAAIPARYAQGEAPGGRPPMRESESKAPPAP